MKSTHPRTPVRSGRETKPGELDLIVKEVFTYGNAQVNMSKLVSAEAIEATEDSVCSVVHQLLMSPPRFAFDLATLQRERVESSKI